MKAEKIRRNRLCRPDVGSHHVAVYAAASQDAASAAAAACQRRAIKPRLPAESAADAMNDPATITGELWAALSDELRGFIRSRVTCESDADDVLQDVFVRIVEKIGSLREAERVQSWVYQIARNAITDYYRRRTQATDPAELAENRPVEEGRGNLNESVAAWLSLMIGALPETLRDAVRMYEMEGLPQSLIAKHLDISLSGAKSRVQRGRCQLENLLRTSCELQTDRRGNVIACKTKEPGGCEQASCDCDD